MDFFTPQPERRHNPVDSICRKLETIRWRGDREPNSPFQIPKLPSSSYNSSRCELRHNLGAILMKSSAVHTDEVAAGGRDGDRGRGRGGLNPTADPRRNSLCPSLPPASPFTPATNPLTKGNVTFTITSTMGERRGGGRSGIPMPGQSRAWQRCQSTSTPAVRTIDSPSSYSAFSRIGQGRSPPASRTQPKTHSMQSYNLNFVSAESGNSTLDCELPYPALVVKRLSMGEGASMSETSKETMSEVSLLCEEDLLDTMFHACDTQRRGKVYVSHIVDYLRNTTCRSSEDSGLEELNNMLDPDHKDVSIDLDTYHAIMKEWIDDRRNNGLYSSLLEIVSPAPAVSPAKTPKKKAVKTKNASRSISELIVNAVSASNERRGVSPVALKKAVAADGYDIKKDNSCFNVAIKSLVADGTLFQTKSTGSPGSFKLNVKAEATKEKNPPKKVRFQFVRQAAEKPPVGSRRFSPSSDAGVGAVKSCLKKPAATKKYPMRMRKPATTKSPEKGTKSHKKAKKPKAAMKSPKNANKPAAAKRKAVKSHKKATKIPTAVKKASANKAAKPKVAKPKKTAAEIKEESTDDLPQDSAKFLDGISAKRSMLLNMTSGSLEGFGGDASRVDLETSDLMYCVADLQMNNTRLQDEVKRLKLVVESTEETNQKLAEENEELHNQARMSQQLALKEKMLKDEVEEMKLTLSSTEEGRARASQHCKNMEKENQSLIANITSLQEENFKVTVEMDELQRRLVELCDHNTELQVQIHSLDALISGKDTILLEKDRQIEELKAAMEEYSSVTELLRANKNTLENQIQMMHPDMSGAGLTLSAAYRLNQTSSGSLQTELTLAQLPLELDETLDREVLLLLQGPNPEHMAMEFRGLLDKLKREFREEVVRLLSTVRSLVEDPRPRETSTDDNLQTVQSELDKRRADWALGLDQLAQYTDSLEKELIKMAGNMRRSRTDILHLSVRVQEQENQKRQLSEELEELKSPQDSREASCQTPDLQQQPEEDLDWDEEFALQDFLKKELEERNCSSRVDDRRTSNNIPVETTQTLNEGPEGDSRTSVDTGGESGAWETFTPPFTHSDSAACPDPEVNCEPAQEEAEVLLNTHSHSVSQETDALLKPTHSNSNDVKGLAADHSVHGGSVQNLSNTSEQDQALTADSTPPRPTDVVQSSCATSESPRPTDTKCGGEGESDGDTSLPTCDMSFAKSLSLNQSADKAVVEDSTSLLPVLEEEEEVTEVTMAGTDALATLPDGGSPDSAIGLCSGDDRALGGQLSPGAKIDPLSLRGKFKRELELSQSMEAIEEHRVQEDPSEVNTASEKEVETSVISDAGSDREDKNGLSANDKEIETEFQRLSLGFKCDMFTLEKRLRLEERSRDLAEENVRKEVSSCQGLLQALIPLCEEDNQSMEIIQRLQKNLDILIQSMTRVSSRSEMLGAIHQESRIGKAVEVMIQHVDNLKRTYTKEHAELLELRETLMQSERSFGSHGAQDDFRGKKQSPSQYYKSSSTRRVTIAAIPRSPGNSMHFDMGKTQDTTDDGERLTRRSPWKQSTVRPPLKRYVSSGAWVEMEEPSLMMRGRTACGDSLSEDEQKVEPVVHKRRSSLSELGSKLTSLILPLKTPSPTPSLTASDSVTAPFLSQGLSTSSHAAVARSGRGLWLWLALVVVLAGLLALLASLVMQPAADASPVGTGDSWMTIQQLLWPYTGLRHNGQPPI